MKEGKTNSKFKVRYKIVIGIVGMGIMLTLMLLISNLNWRAGAENPLNISERKGYITYSKQSSQPQPKSLEDVNKDGKVNLQDLILIAKSFNTKEGNENWNPDADLKKDNLIDIYDLVNCAKKFNDGTSKEPEPKPSANDPAIPRTATFVVAASNSSPQSKKQADFVADGIDDQVEIQAAIDALPNMGGDIHYASGSYYLSGEVFLDFNNFSLDSVVNLIGHGAKFVAQNTSAQLRIGNKGQPGTKFVKRFSVLEGISFYNFNNAVVTHDVAFYLLKRLYFENCTIGLQRLNRNFYGSECVMEDLFFYNCGIGIKYDVEGNALTQGFKNFDVEVIRNGKILMGSSGQKGIEITSNVGVINYTRWDVHSGFGADNCIGLYLDSELVGDILLTGEIPSVRSGSYGIELGPNAAAHSCRLKIGIAGPAEKNNQ